MPRLPRLAIAALILFGGLFAPLAAETVVDEKWGFTCEVPQDFVRLTELGNHKLTHGFLLGDPEDDRPDIILLLDPMSARIGRELLSEKHLPPGTPGKLFTAQWQGLDVQGFYVPEELEGRKFITLNVQLPLKKAGLEVRVFGPAEREEELQALMKTILAGLKGEPTPARPVAAQSSPTVDRNDDSYRYVLLGGAAAMFLFGLVVYYLVSRTMSRGMVLLLGVVVWLAGAGLSSQPQREMLMASGVLKLIGSTGVLLGIFELIRRKPKAAKPPTENAAAGKP